MKCIRIKNRISRVLLGVLTVSVLFGCGKEEFALPYGSMDNNHKFTLEPEEQQKELDLFAADYAAVSGDKTDTVSLNTSDLKAAGLYDIRNKEVCYSYNTFARLDPASLTKLMTALIVFENCSRLDDVITIGDVSIGEEGVQRFGLKAGDRVTARDLLNIMLVQSGNDAALALARYVGENSYRPDDDTQVIDPVDNFVLMMNARASSLGCAATNFVNPHGLTTEGHYSSAYDLYLIFNELIKYPQFLEIIRQDSVTITYNTAEGEVKSRTVTSTDQYLTKGYSTPDNVSVLGGKTGSTASAGKCLILYAENADGNPFIAIIMGAEDSDILYGTMSELLKITNS